MMSGPASKVFAENLVMVIGVTSRAFSLHQPTDTLMLALLQIDKTIKQNKTVYLFQF